MNAYTPNNEQNFPAQATAQAFTLESMAGGHTVLNSCPPAFMGHAGGQYDQHFTLEGKGAKGTVLNSPCICGSLAFMNISNYGTAGKTKSD